MYAGTFGFGCLGLRFLLFLFVLGTLISIPVCLALLALGLAVGFLAADLLRGLAVSTLLLGRWVIVVVAAVVIHFGVAIFVSLAGLLLPRLFPGAFSGLSRLLLALSLLPLDV